MALQMPVDGEESGGRERATADPSAFARHLVDIGKFQFTAFERAKHLAAESNEPLEYVLTKLGLISERDLAEAMAQFLNLPLATVADYPAEPVLEDQLAQKFLREAKVIPLKELPNSVAVAMVNPLDAYVTDAVRFAVGKPLSIHVALPADLEAAHERLYGDGRSGIHQLSSQTRDHVDETVADDVDRLKDIASEAPVIRLVNLLITQAVEARASDIHIEPMENELRGALPHRRRVAAGRIAAAAVVIGDHLARQDHGQAQHRRAPAGAGRPHRDGGARQGHRSARLDHAHHPRRERGHAHSRPRPGRARSAPRWASTTTSSAAFASCSTRPHGILLVTGPDRKRQDDDALYRALRDQHHRTRRSSPSRIRSNISSKGINQVQVKPQIGLTFANALRSFLRQDPDIMMIGEIRDLETAQIAVQAALTGHLILSTLHTNDAASAVTRLLDMGVEDYLLTSTVNGVLAQRLVRTLCRKCCTPYQPMPELVERLHLDRLTGGGPDRSSPRGRLRAMPSHRLSRPHHDRRSLGDVGRDPAGGAQIADSGAIQKIALDEGMQTLAMHGLKKALGGITTIDEVLRVAPVV